MIQLKQGEWKGGEWIPANLQNNNPKGFNKHIKNPKPKVKEMPKKKTKEELIKELGAVFHKQWALKNEVLRLGHRIKEINEELASR